MPAHPHYRTLGLPSRPSSSTSTSGSPIAGLVQSDLLARRQRDTLMLAPNPASTAEMPQTGSSSSNRRASFGPTSAGPLYGHAASSLRSRSPRPHYTTSVGPGERFAGGLGLSIPLSASRRTPLHYDMPANARPIPAPVHPRSRPQDDSPYAARRVGASAFIDASSQWDSDDDSGYLSDHGSTARRGSSAANDRATNQCFAWHDRRQEIRDDGGAEIASLKAPTLPEAWGREDDLFGGSGSGGSSRWYGEAGLAEKEASRIKKRKSGALLVRSSGILPRFSPDMRKSPALPELRPVHAMASPTASPELGRMPMSRRNTSSSYAEQTPTPSLSSSSFSGNTSGSSPCDPFYNPAARRMSMPNTHAAMSTRSTTPSALRAPSPHRARSSTVGLPTWKSGRDGPMPIMTDELASLRLTDAERIKEETRANWAGASGTSPVARPDAPASCFVAAITVKMPKGQGSEYLRYAVQIRAGLNGGHRGNQRARLPPPKLQVEEILRSERPLMVLQWSNGFKESLALEGMNGAEIVAMIKKISGSP